MADAGRSATLRVAVLELSARWDAAADALEDSRRLLGAGHCDLAVLPECALTGYVSPEGDFDLARFAEPLDGPTSRALASLAREAGCAIAGPLVERDGDRLFNTFVVVAPDGTRLAHYRKRHPWFPETWATPGDLPWPRFEVGALACTLAVCFDVHFLSDEMPDALSSVDVLLFPSAWVDDGGEDLRGPILGGLARRHGVTIANANWGVGVPRVRGQGGSRVVGPSGELVRARAGEGARRVDALVAGRRALTAPA